MNGISTIWKYGKRGRGGGARFAVFFLVLALVGGMAIGSIFSRLGEPTPVLSLSQSVIDLHEVPANLEAIRRVEIVNTGNADLVISKILTGCGCTKTTLSPNAPIAPHCTATLTVAFIPGPGAEKSGQVVSVELHSNDSRHPVKRLLVRTQPSKNASTNPELVDFGRISDRSLLPIHRDIVLRSMAGQTDAKCVFLPPECCSYFDVKEIAKGNPDATHRVTIGSDAPSGDVCSDFEYSVGPSGTCRRITFRAHVCGSYLAIPQMATLGPIRPTDTSVWESVKIRRRSRVPRQSGLNPDDVSIACLSPNLDGVITVAIVSGADCVEMTITMTPASYQGTWSERRILGNVELDVRETANTVERLNVPVLVLLKVPKVRDG